MKIIYQLNEELGLCKAIGNKDGLDEIQNIKVLPSD